MIFEILLSSANRRNPWSQHYSVWERANGALMAWGSLKWPSNSLLVCGRASYKQNKFDEGWDNEDKLAVSELPVMKPLMLLKYLLLMSHPHSPVPLTACKEIFHSTLTPVTLPKMLCDACNELATCSADLPSRGTPRGRGPWWCDTKPERKTKCFLQIKPPIYGWSHKISSRPHFERQRRK